MAVQKHIKKEQILNQGIHLLMMHGYHGTGLKLILDTVKVPKGSFYSYFKSKEQFTAEAIAHYIEPFLTKLQGFLDDSSLNGHEAINAYFGSLVTELEQSDYKGGCLLGDMMGEMSGVSDVCRDALMSAVARYCALLERGLVSAQQADIVRNDLSVDSMARLLFDTWQGALLHMKIEKSIAPLQRCTDQLLNGYFIKH